MDSIDKIPDPRKKDEAVIDMIETMLAEANNKIQTVQNQQKLKEETFNHKIHYIDNLCNINILHKFISCNSKPLPASPINYKEKYQQFIQLIDNKQVFIFDLINLFLLYQLERKGVNIRECMDNIHIMATTWCDIINFGIQSEMIDSYESKRAFISWCKKKVIIINHYHDLQSIHESYEQGKNIIICDMYSIMAIEKYHYQFGYCKIDIDKRLLDSYNQHIFSIMYLLEYNFYIGYINIKQLFESCNILCQYFHESYIELYKMPIRYIWNELAVDRSSFDKWHLFKSIHNIESILDELNQENPHDGLKEYVLNKV